MPPEILKRDENHVHVAAAAQNDSDLNAAMLRVDPATNWLMINVITTGTNLATTGETAKRDENHVPVCLAWDETNGVLQEVLTDSDGYLLVDILVV